MEKAGRRRASARSRTRERLGKAQLGDKTLLDALVPFADALESGASAPSGRSRDAWASAAQVADASARRRPPELTARVGRARPLGERSVGTPDPGAVSFALICTTVAGELAGCADGAG